jgi:hypothetical protein
VTVTRIPAKTITGHFMQHWGGPDEIYTRPPLAGLDFAVVRFGHGGSGRGFRLATNGMSSILQTLKEQRFRTELYASSQGDNTWVVELLDALARYPLEDDVALCEFDTIEIGQPIDRKDSPFVAVLLAPPGPDDSETLGAIGVEGEAPVVVHQVIGITRRECDFAMREGGEALWSRIRSLGQTPGLDQSRSEIA